MGVFYGCGSVSSTEDSIQDGGVNDGAIDGPNTDGAPSDAQLFDALPPDASAADAGSIPDATTLDASDDGPPCRSLAIFGEFETVDDAYCEGNEAVICDVATGRWRRQRCGTGMACHTFDVEVHENHGTDIAPDYRHALDVIGADCLPEEAASCEWSFENGRLRSSYEAQCTEDVQSECRRPRIQGPLSSTSKRAAFAFSREGYVHALPCGPEQSCRGTLCEDDDRVPCHTAIFRRSCDGEVLHTCVDGPAGGYEDHWNCADTGGRCVETCDSYGATCVAADARPCDPETYVETCSGPDHLTRCESTCFTRTLECGVRFSGDREMDTVCGDSFDVYTGNPDQARAACLAIDATRCVPSTFTERCEEDAVVYCDGTVSRRDCPAGMGCTVRDGNAGCEIADAAPCDARPWCDEERLISCCDASDSWRYDFASSSQFWCQPGWEFATSCFDRCVEDDFGAWCD